MLNTSQNGDKPKRRQTKTATVGYTPLYCWRESNSGYILSQIFPMQLKPQQCLIHTQQRRDGNFETHLK